MKTRIVKIGNSRGIRLPKPLIEEAGLGEDVELRVVATGLLIERATQTREGWTEAAARMHARGEDVLLDEPSPIGLDDSERAWVTGNHVYFIMLKPARCDAHRTAGETSFPRVRLG